MINKTFSYLEIDIGSIQGGCHASLGPGKLEYAMCESVSPSGDSWGCTLAVPGPIGMHDRRNRRRRVSKF